MSRQQRIQRPTDPPPPPPPPARVQRIQRPTAPPPPPPARVQIINRPPAPPLPPPRPVYGWNRTEPTIITNPWVTRPFSRSHRPRHWWEPRDEWICDVTMPPLYTSPPWRPQLSPGAQREVAMLVQEMMMPRPRMPSLHDSWLSALSGGRTLPRLFNVTQEVPSPYSRSSIWDDSSSSWDLSSSSDDQRRRPAPIESLSTPLPPPPRSPYRIRTPPQLSPEEPWMRCRFPGARRRRPSPPARLIRIRPRTPSPVPDPALDPARLERLFDDAYITGRPMRVTPPEPRPLSPLNTPPRYFNPHLGAEAHIAQRALRYPDWETEGLMPLPTTPPLNTPGRDTPGGLADRPPSVGHSHYTPDLLWPTPQSNQSPMQLPMQPNAASTPIQPRDPFYPSPQNLPSPVRPNYPVIVPRPPTPPQRPSLGDSWEYISSEHGSADSAAGFLAPLSPLALLDLELSLFGPGGYRTPTPPPPPSPPPPPTPSPSPPRTPPNRRRMVPQARPHPTPRPLPSPDTINRIWQTAQEGGIVPADMPWNSDLIHKIMKDWDLYPRPAWMNSPPAPVNAARQQELEQRYFSPTQPTRRQVSPIPSSSNPPPQGSLSPQEFGRRFRQQWELQRPNLDGSWDILGTPPSIPRESYTYSSTPSTSPQPSRAQEFEQRFFQQFQPSRGPSPIPSPRNSPPMPPPPQQQQNPDNSWDIIASPQANGCQQIVAIAVAEVGLPPAVGDVINQQIAASAPASPQGNATLDTLIDGASFGSMPPSPGGANIAPAANGGQQNLDNSWDVVGTPQGSNNSWDVIASPQAQAGCQQVVALAVAEAGLPPAVGDVINQQIAASAPASPGSANIAPAANPDNSWDVVGTPQGSNNSWDVIASPQAGCQQIVAIAVAEVGLPPAVGDVINQQIAASAPASPMGNSTLSREIDEVELPEELRGSPVGANLSMD